MQIPDDIDNMETSGLEVLPPGIYLGRIDATEARYTAAGDPMIVLTITLQQEGIKRRKVWDRLIGSRAAWPRIKTICAQLGIALKPGGELDGAAFLGLEVCVTLEVNSFMGKDQNKVAWNGYTLAVHDASAGAEEELGF